MDRLLAGIISDLRKSFPCRLTSNTLCIHLSSILPHPIDTDPPTVSIHSSYLETLLRDSTASHLLESLITHAPANAFEALWETYFKGRLGKLVAHPVANFVVGKAIPRIDEKLLEAFLVELDGTWLKTVSESPMGRLSLIGY
jgi:nucleolar protein 9